MPIGFAVLCVRKAFLLKGRMEIGKIKLSLVIPVYNRGKLFYNPLDSVAAQNRMGEFECILVDDGIMPDYMDRILGYLDGVSDEKLNIIQYGFCRSGVNGAFKRFRSEKEEKYTTFTESMQGLSVCWNKLYRQTFLDSNGIRFRNDSVIREDEVFNIWTVALAGGMQRIPYVGYHKYDYPERGLGMRTVEQLRKADTTFDWLKEKLQSIGIEDPGVYSFMMKGKRRIRRISATYSPGPANSSSP